MENLWQDIRYGLRMLAKTPGFTLVAVLTLALGIGANTAIFSVINAVLLRPLPFPDPGRLIFVSQVDKVNSFTGIEVSFTKFSMIREQSQSLESAAVYYPLTLSLVSQHEPELVPAARASLDLFRTLGQQPALGRSFLPEEDQPGGRDVAVVTDGFWHSHFGGDPGLIGKTLTLDGRNVTVVGILPPDFRFPLQFPEPQIWLPRVFDIDFLTHQQVYSGAGYLNFLGRLRAGESIAGAQAELDTINARYGQQFAANADPKYGLAVASLEENLVGTLRPSLLVLLGAVGFVLLIACANVASLLLVRATVRGKEIAIRKALGASRLRLVRQLLSESLLLALVGGALGATLAAGLMPLVRAISPGTVPRLEQTTVDGTVLLFTLGLCMLTGLAFGLVPAVQLSGRDLHETLKQGGRGSSDGSARNRFRSLLVVAEVAVALVLLTGAGLLVKSFARLMQVDPGFDSHTLLTFHINLPKAGYAKPEQQVQFYQQLLERVKGVPAAQSVGLASDLPLGYVTPYVFFCPEGMACQGIGKDPVVARSFVSPEYFQALHTPLLRGRYFTDQDVAGNTNVVIVNQCLARRYWPNQDPIGKHLANSRDKIQREVVGVVANVKFSSLSAPDREEMFLPIEQEPWPSATLVVRSQSDPAPLVSAVRQQFSQLDPRLPVSDILSMDEVVSNSVAQPRIIMEFVGVFAGLALLLAAIGIYAVMAYSVNQRRQEMGIRMALGAQPRHILQLVVGHGMGLALVGVGLGTAASFALTRLLASLLFGTGATDPLAFSAATALLASAAFLACYIPARRAARLDPMLALRYE
ncbi:MAG TPA: ABC transporter permease [Terriglobales bacterium]|jgi:putative ABC transport system permease protein|nr:ABC transporter permease [Terriglobales bacterium]